MTPFAALGIGFIMAIIFLRRWKTARAGEPVTHPDLSGYEKKVEEELKKFVPED